MPLKPMLSEQGWRARMTAGMALFAALVVVSTAGVILLYAHPVLFKDSWQTIDLFEAWLRHDLTISLFWVPWEEHRIFFPKLLYLLDYLWADGTGSLLVCLNLTLQGLMAILMVAVLRRQPDLTGTERFFFSSMAVISCFWLVQSGNLNWGFQVAWFLNGLAAAFSAFLVAGIAREEGKFAVGMKLLGAVLCAVVASYSLANGILIWPVLLVVLLKTPVSGRALFVWVAVGAMVAALYLSGYQEPPQQAHFRDIFRLRNAHYLLVYLGNPLSRASLLLGAGTGAVGLGLFGFFTVRFFGYHRPGFFAKFAFAQTAYVFGTALVTAVGRSQFGIDHATASRYYPPILIFWFFLLAQAYAALLPRLRPARTLLVGTFCLLVVLIGFGQMASVPERRIRYVLADHAALALAAGVRDAAALHYITHYPDSTWFWRRNDFLRSHRLSIYRQAWARTLRGTLAGEYAIDPRPPLKGELFGVEVRGGASGPGRFVHGRIDPGTNERIPKVILIVEEGRVAGFARTPGRSCKGCFSGYAAGSGGAVPALFGLDGEDSRTVRLIQVLGSGKISAPFSPQ